MWSSIRTSCKNKQTKATIIIWRNVPTSPNYENKQAAHSASRIDLTASPHPGGDSGPDAGRIVRLGGAGGVGQARLDGGVGQGRLGAGGAGQVRLGARKEIYSLGTVNSPNAEPGMPVISIEWRKQKKLWLIIVTFLHPVFLNPQPKKKFPKLRQIP